MKKNMIALAVAAAMVPGFAAAEGATVSGFVEVSYTNSSDLKDTADAKTSAFGANGEIDVRNTMGDVTVGLDVDMDLAVGGGSAELEQAFFAWNAGAATIIGGVINNPIGLDAEDKPDMVMNTHSAVYDALDSQTALGGNNIAGLAAAFGAGPATVTLALLNDIGHNTDDNGDDTHSIAAVVNMSPIDGLDLELGHVTQEHDGVTVTGVTADDANYKLADGTNVIAGVGNVTNFNAAYTMGQFSASLDYLMPSEVIDSVYDITLGFQANDKLGVALRISELAYADDADVDGVSSSLDGAVYDASAAALNVNYKIADNLKVAAELYTSETDAPGDEGKDKATIKFVATF